MLNSPLISDLIFKGEVHEIKEIMKKSRELGMQTFDQALFDLYEAGEISYEDALRNADSRQRPAPDDQAARQGSEEPRHHRRHRASRYREVERHSLPPPSLSAEGGSLSSRACVQAL